MKKFIFKIALLFGIVALADFLLGNVFDYMLSHARGGDSYRDNYICDSTNHDMLILGCSRALRHYNPAIIEDSLGISCYNCGQNGQGIISNYGFLKIIKNRYAPKYVVYEIFPLYDLLKDDNHKYLGLLKPYYKRNGVQDIFDSVDNMERIKMVSTLYRFNTRFLHIVQGYLSASKGYDSNGYWPLKSESFDALRVMKPEIKDEYELDTLKLAYFKKMIEESGETKIIFAVSPLWYGMDEGRLKPIYEICKQYDIPLIDYSNHPKYYHHNEYFRDGSHLNNQIGADEFTRDFIEEFKKIYY